MNGWIGVDLDGTLAHYDRWKGADHIGDPVPIMVKRVKQWIKEGKTVKIFTARVCDGLESTKILIQMWCLKHIGVKLEVTNVKDYSMIELWDDRCVQVHINTGYSIQEASSSVLYSDDYLLAPICPTCYGKGCWMCEQN